MYSLVIHRQTVSLYHNFSVWLDTVDSRSWDRNLADSNDNPRSYNTTTRKLTLMYHICFVYIYTLNGYRELN